MNNDLERSVQLLEDALSSTDKGLLKKIIGKSRKDTRLDLSLTVAPHEIKKFLSTDETVMYDETTTTFLYADKSVLGNMILGSRMPWKTTLDGLCTEFFEILQSHSGGYDILDIVSDLARCCTDALKVIQDQKAKIAVSYTIEDIWLKNEANTWKLIFILYQDRLLSQNLKDDKDITQYFGSSEEACIQNLFKRDSLVRESQLIIDWLECNAADADYEVLHFSDDTVGWENTLHQLQSADTICFGSSRQIVTQMDPDAPYVQHRPLHDLDMEDERRLSRRIFAEIRCGKLEEAQKLCRQYGHPWRAAMFEGWRLFHNPNIKDDFDKDLESDSINNVDEEMDTNEPREIRGNCNRDVWKSIAIKYCKQEYLSDYEKAAVGVYCGYISSVLPVCHTWEDSLWAYMKTMVDIRVESEIRDYCLKNKEPIPLPEEYWMQRASLNEIFVSLETSKNSAVREESSKPEHLIQKYIILDEISNLLCKLKEWIEDNMSPTYFLRFIAHLVLFFDQIGEGHDRNTIEKVLEAYIKRLMEMNETRLVAYYVSKVNRNSQVHLYSQYLEKVVDNEERKACLMYAENCGLDVMAITKQVVENIRNIPYGIEDSSDLQEKITDIDKYKIDALNWVFLYEDQRAEALVQTNALVFTFLTLGKMEAAHLAFEKIRVGTVEKILDEGNISGELSQTIKEYFSYKAYLDANEAFNEWFKQFKSQPIQPDELPKNAQFAEKVAHQHKMSQYKAEMERWKLTTSHLAKSAKTMLYNVLLFPEGWLVGVGDADYLRSTCIPKVVLLLYIILLESKQYVECIQLADLIASETHKIYKVYSKEKLQEILEKICEVSVALLNSKKDPWGNDVSV